MAGFEHGLGLCLLGAVDVDLGLDNRYQALSEDLMGYLELLVHDGLDAGIVGHFDERAHLCTEDALFDRLGPGLSPNRGSAS